MARDRCRICGEIVLQNRSSQLKKKHGIDSSYRGAVKDYFEEVR